MRPQDSSAMAQDDGQITTTLRFDNGIKTEREGGVPQVYTRRTTSVSLSKVEKGCATRLQFMAAFDLAARTCTMFP
jgi:hypothetical protein